MQIGLISAVSKTSILLAVVIVALAIVGVVVDILAKKKGNGIDLGVDFKKKEHGTSEDDEIKTTVVSEEVKSEDSVTLDEDVQEEKEIEETVQEVCIEDKTSQTEEEKAVDETVDKDDGVKGKEGSDKGFVSKAYSRSYMSKLIQSEQTTQQRYSSIKNELLSYAKMRSSVAWTNETFRTGNKTVARIMLRGKTVMLLLALDPNEFTTTKYAGEDVSDVKRYANTPMRLRVTSERRLKYALELIALLVGREGYEKNTYTPVEYSYEYQTDEQLIQAGLIKVE